MSKETIIETIESESFKSLTEKERKLVLKQFKDKETGKKASYKYDIIKTVSKNDDGTLKIGTTNGVIFNNVKNKRTENNKTGDKLIICFPEDNSQFPILYKKKNDKLIILLLLLLLLLITVGGILYFKHFKDKLPEPVGTVTIQNSEEDEDATNPLKGLYVTYSGITDTNISADSVIELENLKENGDIVMKFTIYEGSKKLYESDYIKSGSHINWEIGKALNKGEHTLKVVQTPRIEVDGKWVPLTSGTCECTLTRF